MAPTANKHFITGSGSKYPYIYYWNRMGRKGQSCQVLARGKMNSCLVIFQDGYTAVTSRNAIRKAVGAR